MGGGESGGSRGKEKRGGGAGWYWALLCSFLRGLTSS